MRLPQLRLSLEDELIVDSFAGGGGASLGIELALGRSPDIAINHDPEAIALHAANHPTTRHLCESVWDVDPVEVCGGRPVGLMWMSPDCTFHSKARGGKPFRDRNKARRRRGLAWIAIRWARTVKPRIICLENVEEFQKWGPLLDDGQPCPDRIGLTFRRWIRQLENCGYVVEYKQLRGCDYGAPTIRKRLFLIARCDRQPIVWPAPTHAAKPALGLAPWRTAAECIDWSIPCPSIFERAKPLAENTQRRIAAGIKRYVIDSPKPFERYRDVVQCHHNYVSRENHFGQNVIVTRKGAVSAREGQLGIIPGSMGARSYIVRGKGNPDSFHSCSHGAGRTMSRTQAAKTFTLEDHAAATAGVECRKDAGVLDETPGAYKSIDDVMFAQRDLVDVVHTLKQVLCVKG